MDRLAPNRACREGGGVKLDPNRLLVDAAPVARSVPLLSPGLRSAHRGEGLAATITSWAARSPGCSGPARDASAGVPPGATNLHEGDRPSAIRADPIRRKPTRMAANEPRKCNDI
jgi:hypothetical protein